jgi:hypothetical protein
MNSAVAALRFFFRVTLNHPEMGRQLTLIPLPERLRVVLSQGEVAQLLDRARRRRACLRRAPSRPRRRGGLGQDRERTCTARR